MKSIDNADECHKAAKHFDKSPNNVKVDPAVKGDTRPIGCTWHETNHLELFEESSGKCNVDGYDGCFCLKTIGKVFISLLEVFNLY